MNKTLLFTIGGAMAPTDAFSIDFHHVENIRSAASDETALAAAQSLSETQHTARQNQRTVMISGVIIGNILFGAVIAFLSGIIYSNSLTGAAILSMWVSGFFTAIIFAGLLNLRRGISFQSIIILAVFFLIRSVELFVSSIFVASALNFILNVTVSLFSLTTNTVGTAIQFLYTTEARTAGDAALADMSFFFLSMAAIIATNFVGVWAKRTAENMMKPQRTS